MTLLAFLKRLFRRAPPHLRGKVPHEGGVGTDDDTHYVSIGREIVRRNAGANAPAAPLVTRTVREVGAIMVEVRWEHGLVCPDPRRAYLAQIPTIFEAEALGVASEWCADQQRRRAEWLRDQAQQQRPTALEAERRDQAQSQRSAVWFRVALQDFADWCHARYGVQVQASGEWDIIRRVYRMTALDMKREQIAQRTLTESELMVYERPTPQENARRYSSERGTW